MLKYEIKTNIYLGCYVVLIVTEGENVCSLYVDNPAVHVEMDLARNSTPERLQQTAQLAKVWYARALEPFSTDDIIAVLMVARDECIDRGLLPQ